MTLSFSILVIVGSVLTSCTANEGVLRSGRSNSSSPAGPTPEVSPFERDLAEAKGAGFTWLYVIRRRDGGILTAEDKAFIKQHSADANRRILTDGERAVIIGSNYSVTAEGARAIKERLDVADHSSPPANR